MSNTPVSDGFQTAKAWYQSKTIIGIIIAAISTLVKAFMPETDVQGAVDEILSADPTAASIDQIIASAVQAFGLLMALYGRVKARLGIK